MVNEPFDHDDGWPDPHVLAAWRVPTLPDEFADRVIAQARFAAPFDAPRRVPSRSRAPFVAAIAAAIAMAAVLVLVFAVRSERLVPPQVVATPEPAEPAVAGGIEIPTVTTSALVIDVSPTDATVIVDGRTIGGTAPFVAHELTMGPHVVDVRRVGFVPRVEIVHVEGVPRRLAFELAPLDLTAPVLPEPASKVPRHDARKPDMQRDLKDPFEGRRHDDDGAGSSRDLKDPFGSSPAPAAKRTSRLRIGVNPGLPPAKVTVDGAAVGTTPIANLRVAPGVHRIRWDWNDGRVFEQRIEIDDGETMLVKGG